MAPSTRLHAYPRQPERHRSARTAAARLDRHRLPRFINSDHLSALGLVVDGRSPGCAFAAFRVTPWAAARSWSVTDGELVRRQPGRHRRTGPRAAAAALRVLRRSHHRSRGHDDARCRHGMVRADAPARRQRRARRVSARLRRVLSRDACRRRLQDVVSRLRTDRAPAPADGRRTARDAVPVGAIRSATGRRSACSISAVSSRRQALPERSSQRRFATAGRSTSPSRFPSSRVTRRRHEPPGRAVHHGWRARVRAADIRPGLPRERLALVVPRRGVHCRGVGSAPQLCLARTLDLERSDAHSGCRRGADASRTLPARDRADLHRRKRHRDGSAG